MSKNSSFLDESNMLQLEDGIASPVAMGVVLQSEMVRSNGMLLFLLQDENYT